jgi:uncharacterized membrane protein YhaH (DUF805 family)
VGEEKMGIRVQVAVQRRGSGMVGKIQRWFDPRVPVGRIAFVIAQCLGSGIEGALRRKMWPLGASTKTLFVACVLMLTLFLVTLTAKRLLDAGWSRGWTFAILGPALFDILFGTGNANSAFLKMAFYPLFVSYVGYMLLVVVLCVVPSQEVEAVG